MRARSASHSVIRSSSICFLLSYPRRGQFLVTPRGQFSMARDRPHMRRMELSPRNFRSDRFSGEPPMRMSVRRVRGPGHFSRDVGAMKSPPKRSWSFSACASSAKENTINSTPSRWHERVRGYSDSGSQKRRIVSYSAVSNIGYIWCFEEGSYETRVVLEVD